MAGFDEVRTIVFRFVGDDSDLQRSTAGAGQSMRGLEGSTKKTSGALAAMAPVAKAAGIAAAAAAAKWAVDGIGMAQTAEMVGASFDKTFGDAADGFLADNEAMRKAMGLTESEFQQMSLTMGQTAMASGQSREEAAEFSATLITMAADVAAFNGDLAQSEEVLGAMQAGLRGEYDPLERFGVAIKQADVNTRALNDTGKASADMLTNLEKQQAFVALMTEQLGDEMGTMQERMADGSTAQNEMTATLGDLQAEVGSALIPFKEFVLKILVALLPLLKALTPLLDLVAVLFDAIFTVLGPLIDAIAAVVGWFAKLIDYLIRGTGFLDRLKRGVDSLRVALKNTFSVSMPSWLRNIVSLGGRLFHSGGVVPGPVGSPQPIMAQGGETITPAGSARSSIANGSGGGTGTVINVTVNAGVGDPIEIGRQVADVLGEYGRQTGPLDIPVRATG